MRIKIVIGDLSMEGELNDTPTACKVAEALPIRASFSTWGDEIYFTIPVVAELDESAREEVELGVLGYWPTGKAFCIFFGPTPASSGEKPVAASAVNVLGNLTGDFENIRDIPYGAMITIERVE